MNLLWVKKSTACVHNIIETIPHTTYKNIDSFLWVGSSDQDFSRAHHDGWCIACKALCTIVKKPCCHDKTCVSSEFTRRRKCLYLQWFTLHCMIKKMFTNLYNAFSLWPQTTSSCEHECSKRYTVEGDGIERFRRWSTDGRVLETGEEEPRAWRRTPRRAHSSNEK